MSESESSARRSSGSSSSSSYTGVKMDCKEVNLRRRYGSGRGKMMPSRITSVSMKRQRELAQAIKRARFLALLPYSDKRSGG